MRSIRDGTPFTFLKWAVLLFFLAAVAFWVGRTNFLRPDDRSALSERVAQWIGANALPADRIAAPLSVCRKARSVAECRIVCSEARSAAECRIDDLLSFLASYRPDFLVASSSLPWQLLPYQPWFQERYRLVHRELNPYEPASTLQVYQYVPSPFDVGEAITTPLTFTPGPNQQLELTAYRLDRPRLVPGWPVHLTLYWRAATVLAQPVRLTLYLRPESGGSPRKWTETTAPGGLPTDLWTPDVLMTDRYLLFPPADLAPGDYCLELALHLPSGQPVCSEARSGAECRIRLYRPATVSTEPPRPDHPLQLTLGDGIELVGYDAPDWAVRGQPFRVALYWHATGPISADYKVFVHLLTADGGLLAQDDSEPVAWTYPTGRWQVGEYVMDEHRLTLPADVPRGEVWLSVGMYNPVTGARLPVYDEGGARHPEDRAVLRPIRIY
ncbi:MAG: hypothetical protein ACK4WK_00070 [Anaerolineae bacterium]